MVVVMIYAYCLFGKYVLRVITVEDLITQHIRICTERLFERNSGYLQTAKHDWWHMFY
jgi:hypothetical protein